MIKLTLNELKHWKNQRLLLIVFALVMALYILMDNFGYQTYKMIGDAFGYQVVVQTMTLNVLISLISAFTITLSVIHYKMNQTKTSGSIFATIGNVFAMVFSGCSSCGITVLSAIGISVGLPTILPGAVKFKFIALLFIVLGLIWVLYVIQTSTCKITLEEKDEA